MSQLYPILTHFAQSPQRPLILNASDGGKNLGTPPSSRIPLHRHPTLSSSTDPYKPILNHGLQEMRKGEHTPLLFFHLCHRQTTLTNNSNRALDNRNFRKLPHRTRSHLPRARSKRAPERSAEGTLCYPDQVLQRRRLDHPQWEDRRTGSQYVLAPTPSPPGCARFISLEAEISLSSLSCVRE